MDPSAVANWASRLPLASKSSAAVVLIGYLLQLLAPGIRKYLALVPARAVPCVWMLVTSGFLETRLIKAITSAASLAVAGSILEPCWGPRELATFLLVADVGSSAAGLVTGYVHYATNVYARDAAKILFSEFNGAHGIIAGCLVALTQVMPDEDVSWGGNGGGGVRVKHLLASYVAAATVVSLFTKSLLSTLPVVLAGAYSSWLYLRFVQVKEGLGLRGDPSSAFSLSTFFSFSEPLARAVDSLSTAISRAIGAGSDDADFLSSAPTPAPLSEASARRRERGARALEAKMSGKTSVPHKDPEVAHN